MWDCSISLELEIYILPTTAQMFKTLVFKCIQKDADAEDVSAPAAICSHNLVYTIGSTIQIKFDWLLDI